MSKQPPEIHEIPTRTKRTPRKTAMFCSDGPMQGVTLWLSTPETMWMNINGVVGRYVKGKWEQRC